MWVCCYSSLSPPPPHSGHNSTQQHNNNTTTQQYHNNTTIPQQHNNITTSQQHHNNTTTSQQHTTTPQQQQHTTTQQHRTTHNNTQQHTTTNFTQLQQLTIINVGVEPPVWKSVNIVGNQPSERKYHTAAIWEEHMYLIGGAIKEPLPIPLDFIDIIDISPLLHADSTEDNTHTNNLVCTCQRRVIQSM